MLSLLCYAVSQTIYINKHFENDLLAPRNDVWFIVLRALLRQYKDFQVAEEDY